GERAWRLLLEQADHRNTAVKLLSPRRMAMVQGGAPVPSAFLNCVTFSILVWLTLTNKSLARMPSRSAGDPGLTAITTTPVCSGLKLSSSLKAGLRLPTVAPASGEVPISSATSRAGESG